MSSILSYFNTFLDVIFNGALVLYSPSACYNSLSSIAQSSSSFEDFILNFLVYPDYIFSYFVWIWFSVLTFNLLLSFPYKWIRSVIRKCTH